MMALRWFMIAVLMLPGTGCVDDSSGELGEDRDFAALVEGYHELQRLTDRPIEFLDIGLCRLPVPGLDTPLHEEVGQIHVYVNRLAAGPMAQPGERSFPEGSVIVKEKLRQGEVVGLGMMIRREPDPGGWTFGYFEAGQLYDDAAQLEPCRYCHVTGELPDAGAGILLGVGDSLTAEQLRAMTRGYWGLLPGPRDGVFLTLPEPQT